MVKKYGVWFAGRNTAVVVSADSRSQAITKARELKRRGGNEVVSARPLTGTSLKQANSGKWVRERSDGKSPAKSSVGKGRGQGPPRK